LDFYCAKAKLAVEIDGNQHYEPEAIEKDAERTAILNGYDVEVIRFSNNEVKNSFHSICEAITHSVIKRLA
jgi:very-short-patch-repair endonuclease